MTQLRSGNSKIHIALLLSAALVASAASAWGLADERPPPYLYDGFEGRRASAPNELPAWNTPMRVDSEPTKRGVKAASTGGGDGPAFSLGADSVTDEFFGNFALIIEPLLTGEEVFVEQYLAPNGGGIDENAILMNGFSLVEGHSESIDGRVNINVPFDDSDNEGTVFSWMNFFDPGISQIQGDYVFRLSSPSGRFAPIERAFEVTSETDYGQSFQGVVEAGGEPVAGAIVAILETSGGGYIFQRGVVTDAEGRYELDVPAEEYWVVAVKPGYVGNLGLLSSVTLEEGATVALDPPLVEATRTIGGRLHDAADPAKGLPGVRLFLQNGEGRFCVAVTDADGFYEAGVTVGEWSVAVLSDSMNHLGYVAPDSAVLVDTEGTETKGVDFPVRRGDALMFGQVRQAVDGSGWPGVRVRALNLTTGEAAMGTTDMDGYFTIAATRGNWQVEVDYDSISHSFLGRAAQNVAVRAGKAVGMIFDLELPSTWFTGTVDNEDGAPVAGAMIKGADTNGNYATTFTREDGHYSLPVTGGEWSVVLTGAEGRRVAGHFHTEVEIEDFEVHEDNLAFIARPVRETLSVRVLGGDSEPLADVLVDLRHKESVTSGFRSWAMTGVDGVAEIPVFDGDWNATIENLSWKGHRPFPGIAFDYPGKGVAFDIELDAMALGSLQPVSIAGGRLDLRLSDAEPETAYSIQASDDLSSWEEVGVMTTDGDGVFEADDDPDGSASRFYRAERLP